MGREHLQNNCLILTRTHSLFCAVDCWPDCCRIDMLPNKIDKLRNFTTVLSVKKKGKRFAWSLGETSARSRRKSRPVLVSFSSTKMSNLYSIVFTSLYSYSVSNFQFQNVEQHAKQMCLWINMPSSSVDSRRPIMKVRRDVEDKDSK